MPYLDRDDVSIFYDITGSGIPVITTHGFIENGSYWGRSGTSAALARAGYCVVDMDMRGHGRSAANVPMPSYSVEAVVSDIGTLADSLGFGRFHLLTHATGGMAGARYAIQHHRRLLSLISTDTGSATMAMDKYASPEWDDRPVPPWNGVFKPTVALANMVRQVGNLGQLVPDIRAQPDSHPLALFFNRFSSNADPERCWRWTQDIYAVNNPETCADFALGFFKDPDPQVAGLRRITCPSMVMIGEHDVLLRKPAEQLARNIPNSEFCMLPGVGHMTAIEDPAQTQAAMLSFLGRHSQRS